MEKIWPHPNHTESVTSEADLALLSSKVERRVANMEGNFGRARLINAASKFSDHDQEQHSRIVGNFGTVGLG